MTVKDLGTTYLNWLIMSQTWEKKNTVTFKIQKWHVAHVAQKLGKNCGFLNNSIFLGNMSFLEPMGTISNFVEFCQKFHDNLMLYKLYPLYNTYICTEYDSSANIEAKDPWNAGFFENSKYRIYVETSNLSTRHLHLQLYWHGWNCRFWKCHLILMKVLFWLF